MPTQIKDFPNQGSPASGDKFLLQEASGDACKHTTRDEVGKAMVDGGIVASPRWHEIDSDRYTATPASTSQITMSDTGGLSAMLPIRYTYGGTAYYGLIKSVSADSSIDIQGPTLNVGSDLTKLEVGTPEMLRQIQLFVNGAYGDGAADLLSSDLGAHVDWDGGDAYVVFLKAVHAVADTGAAQPKVNAKAGGNLISDNDSNNGIQLSSAGTRVKNPDIAINPSNYKIVRDDVLEVRCTVAGSNGDAEDLLLTLLIVQE